MIWAYSFEIRCLNQRYPEGYISQLITGPRPYFTESGAGTAMERRIRMMLAILNAPHTNRLEPAYYSAEETVRRIL